jgi:hypothetical protein
VGFKEGDHGRARVEAFEGGEFSVGRSEFS